MIGIDAATQADERADEQAGFEYIIHGERRDRYRSGAVERHPHPGERPRSSSTWVKISLTEQIEVPDVSGIDAG